MNEGSGGRREPLNAGPVDLPIDGLAHKDEDRAARPFRDAPRASFAPLNQGDENTEGNARFDGMELMRFQELRIRPI